MRDYNFGNFLQRLRTQRGFTQYQLGALVGVSDGVVDGQTGDDQTLTEHDLGHLGGLVLVVLDG